MACVGLLCDLVGNCSFGCIILCCIHDPEGFWLYFERCCRRNVNPFDISKLQPPQNCNSVSAEGVDAGKQEQHSEQTHPGQGKTVKFRQNSVIWNFFSYLRNTQEALPHLHLPCPPVSMNSWKSLLSFQKSLFFHLAEILERQNVLRLWRVFKIPLWAENWNFWSFLGGIFCSERLCMILKELPSKNVAAGVVGPFKLHSAMFGVFGDVVLMWH